MSEDLFCNDVKCNKPLISTGYLTACSHAFCEEHGTASFTQKIVDLTCPACQTPLVKSYDVVKSNLNPSEQFKSMVLAGLKPEVVLDIANRALSFWNYQKYQEHLQQELIVKNLKDSLETMSAKHSNEVCMFETDKQNLTRKQKELEKDLEVQKQKTDEVNEKLLVKMQEAAKFKNLCETFKKRQLSTILQQQQSQKRQVDHSPVPHYGPQTMGEFQNSPVTKKRLFTSNGDVADRNSGQFNFQPQLSHDFPSPKNFLQSGYKRVNE